MQWYWEVRETDRPETADFRREFSVPFIYLLDSWDPRRKGEPGAQYRSQMHFGGTGAQDQKGPEKEDSLHGSAEQAAQ